MRQLLIASKNTGKIQEMKAILSGAPFEIKSLSDIGKDIKVEETGKTFEENAILKAKTIGEKTKHFTLGEDSGLEVDALGSKPGIYSARYAPGSDENRMSKTLDELKRIPKEKRTARFRTVIALYNPDTKSVQTFEGVSEGYITQEPIGTNGFGYDPIFFNSELGKTNAQASFSEKNRVSHRAKALSKCKEFLETLK